jgi:hypothetical protein
LPAVLDGPKAGVMPARRERKNVAETAPENGHSFI